MIFFVWVGHSHIGHADKLHIWMLSTNLSNGMWKLWRNINHPWPCDLHHVTLGQHWLLISVLFWQAIVDFLWMSVFHTRKDWKRQLQLEYFLKGSEFWVTFCLHVLFFFLFFFGGGEGGRCEGVHFVTCFEFIVWEKLASTVQSYLSLSGYDFCMQYFC